MKIKTEIIPGKIGSTVEPNLVCTPWTKAGLKWWDAYFYVFNSLELNLFTLVSLFLELFFKFDLSQYLCSLPSGLVALLGLGFKLLDNAYTRT